VLYYSLARDSGDVSLEIRDPSGGLVRKLEAKGEKGLHRIVWDLRREARRGRGGGDQRFSRRGPRVEPGRYDVVLVLDGESLRQPLVVETDPDFENRVWLEFQDAEDEADEEDGDGGRDVRDG
jgi:hypothetical protein